MARFIGYVKGQNGGEVTRFGTKASGLTARANGWRLGVRADISHDGVEDVVALCINDGSGTEGLVRTIGSYRRRDLVDNDRFIRQTLKRMVVKAVSYGLDIDNLMAEAKAQAREEGVA